MRCREEFPLVQRVQKKFKDDGLVVIGIGFQDTRDNIAQCIKDLNISEVTFVYDKDSKIAERYGITYVAASVFIDKKGIVSRLLPSGFNEPQLLKEIYRIVN